MSFIMYYPNLTEILKLYKLLTLHAACDEISCFMKYRVFGRAIAQAVSRRLPTAAARIQTRAWSCGIL
jgi:hypothetical protein